MLKWDTEEVGQFLGVTASFNDNSSYTFCFPMFGGAATLEVFPDNGEVEFAVRVNGSDACATWRMDCREIKYNDELPEEGGPCLVFYPASVVGKRPTHWVVLGRTSSELEVLTVFCQDAG
jgi:hypothetical protein